MPYSGVEQGELCVARVQDKVAIVTGAASGIGLATARLMVEEGANVVLTDIALEAGEQAEEALGMRASFRHLDVVDEATSIKVIEETEHRFGRLDILVNSAGIAVLKDVEATAGRVARDPRGEPRMARSSAASRDRCDEELRRRIDHQPVVGRGPDRDRSRRRIARARAGCAS